MTETELKPFRRGYYQYKAGEVLDVIIAIPFAQGCVLKYLFRPGKGRYIEDLGKALFYLQQARDTADSAISRVLPISPYQSGRLIDKVNDFADELAEHGFPLAGDAARAAMVAFACRDKDNRASCYARAEELIKQQIADLKEA